MSTLKVIKEKNPAHDIYHVTISPKPEDFDHIPIDDIRDWVEKISNRYIIINEFGKDGNHPHYHIGMLLKRERRQDSMLRSITGIFKKNECEFLSPQLIKVVKHYDFEGLIGYIHKEKDFSLVDENIKDIDLKECIRKYEAKECKGPPVIEQKEKKSKRMTVDQTVEAFLDYLRLIKYKPSNVSAPLLSLLLKDFIKHNVEKLSYSNYQKINKACLEEWIHAVLDS